MLRANAHYLVFWKWRKQTQQNSTSDDSHYWFGLNSFKTTFFSLSLSLLFSPQQKHDENEILGITKKKAEGRRKKVNSIGQICWRQYNSFFLLSFNFLWSSCILARVKTARKGKKTSEKKQKENFHKALKTFNVGKAILFVAFFP